MAAGGEASSGGFLRPVGGGGSSRGSDPIPGASNTYAHRPAHSRRYAPQQQQELCPQAAARGGGFMAGALQTAAGVAGGWCWAMALTSMFSGSHPQDCEYHRREARWPDADAPPRDAAAGDDPFHQDDQFLADTWTTT